MIYSRFPPSENLSYHGGGFFTAHLAFDLLNSFVLLSLARWGLIICVFLLFFFFFLFPPGRKASLLLSSVSLILHPQLVCERLGVTPTFQGDKSCRRQGLLFKVQYLEEEFLLPEIAPGRNNLTGNNPVQRGFIASF